MSFGRSLLHFFIFILRFWNQILTCLSVRFRSLATSYLRSRERYILNRNSFSSSRVWCLVYGQRFFLVDFACSQLDAGLSARRVGERELVMLRPFYDQRRRKKEKTIKATIQFWYAEIGKHNHGIHASGLREDFIWSKILCASYNFLPSYWQFWHHWMRDNKGHAVYPKIYIYNVQKSRLYVLWQQLCVYIHIFYVTFNRM